MMSHLFLRRNRSALPRVRPADRSIIRRAKSDACRVVNVFVWLSLVSVVISVSSSLSVAKNALPESWRDDADLTDLCFVDERFGWAVGQFGTIWQTQNGGAIWQRQNGPVTATLASVHFIDRQHGWIAGGRTLPITHRSVGFILSTTDGGRTWTEIPGLLLPWVKSVHFSDRMNGVAVGHCSAVYPTGVFRTRDGGRTWSPVGGETGGESHGDFIAADFDNQHGLLVTAKGQPFDLQDEGIQRLAGVTWPAFFHSFSAASINHDHHLLGSSGPPLISVNGGASWQSAEVARHELNTLRVLDMEAIGHLSWQVGSPGTRILHSSDYTRTWQLQPTGTELPLTAVQFTNEREGWAVGFRGTILHTDDGGNHWSVQRGGNKRAAMLAIFSDPQRVPWAVLARVSAVDQYRLHVVLLSDQRSSSEMRQLGDRWLENCSAIGASGQILTRLPLLPDQLEHSAADAFQNWQSVQPDVMNMLAAELTSLIRTWRPDVVMCESAKPSSDQVDGASELLARLIADACSLSASEAAYPEQRLMFGLTAWKPKRIIHCQSTGPFKPTTIDHMDSLPLQQKVHSIATDAVQRFGDWQTSRRRSWSMTTSLADPDVKTPDQEIGLNPFAGVPVTLGSAARRVQPVPPDNSVHKQRDLNHQYRIRQLLREGGSGMGPGGAVDQLSQLLKQLDRDEATDTLLQLSIDAWQAGRWQESEQLLRQLFNEYADHPLHATAAEWLLRFYSSSEIQWLLQQNRSPQPSVRVVSLDAEPPASTPSRVDPASAEANEPTTAVTTLSAEDIADAHPWKNDSNGLGDYQKQFAEAFKTRLPALFHEPDIGFQFATLSRNQNDLQSAQAVFRRITAASHTDSRWTSRAIAETQTFEADKRGFDSIFCPLVTQPPLLDGKLEDAVWQTAAQTPLAPSIQMQRAELAPKPLTTIRWAKDTEYLYLGIACSKSETLHYAPTRRPRPRDANLTSHDRVILEFDINRDYASGWRFEFDHRGWTRESLLHHPAWNPRYFVASTQNEHEWILEIAIPQNQLGPSERWSNSAWIVQACRIIPGERIDTFPNQVDHTQGMNERFLIFQE